MKFSEYQYEHIDKEDTIQKYTIILKDIAGAKDYTSFKHAFDQYQDREENIDTMYSLCYTRFNMNTADVYYKDENAYWDEVLPHFQNMTHQIEKSILSSPFKKQLEEEVPATYIPLLKNAQDIFHESIIPQLQEENKLSSEYDITLAKVRLILRGKEYTLTNFSVMMTHKDRKIREEAYHVYCNFMQEYEEILDDIYHQLVKVRDIMAKKLGYENYIALGYKRMNRLDYTQEDVQIYREEVLKEVVPLASLLYEKQKERLQVDTLHCFDEAYKFKSGNPTPKHSSEKMLLIAKQMYSELSKETKSFFDFMLDHELMDVESKPNKAGGGYCTYFPKYHSPFIFANFNKTSGDVDVLTHEAGHAFQAYSSQNISPLACMSPTLESCEIHSLSMEFFAWPWMKDFFEEDVDKYYYEHLSSSFTFLPYGVLVDHFQHEVYAHPQASKEERKKMWRELEKKYLPHKNYEGFTMLEKGCWWYKQSHIFQNPFYYIDYTLAQICALQFWLRLQNHDEKAFDDYYRICCVGGTLSFTQICELANLTSPFKKNSLHDVVKKGKQYLESMDDSHF